MSHSMKQVSDSTARKAAANAGLVAKRSRRFRNTADNRGGFMVLNPERNAIVAGARFDLTAQQVVDLCRGNGR
jgi:hypothetical protein